jgi:hypothetical protein
MACFNPLWAEERGRKRRELLEASEKGLTKISQEVARRKKKTPEGGRDCAQSRQGAGALQGGQAL